MTKYTDTSPPEFVRKQTAAECCSLVCSGCKDAYTDFADYKAPYRFCKLAIRKEFDLL